MTTLEHSQPTLFDETELPLMSSAEGSRARILVGLGTGLDWQEREAGSGANMQGLLANYSRSSCSWKTSQHCLLEGLETFSETWPRSGMMRNGIAYQLPPLVRLMSGIASGLWGTPTASRGFPKRDEFKSQNIRWQIRERFGVGPMNPRFTEWLMGFPMDHSAAKPLATPLSRKSRNSSAERS